MPNQLNTSPAWTFTFQPCRCSSSRPEAGRAYKPHPPSAAVFPYGNSKRVLASIRSEGAARPATSEVGPDVRCRKGRRVLPVPGPRWVLIAKTGRVRVAPVCHDEPLTSRSGTQELLAFLFALGAWVLPERFGMGRPGQRLQSGSSAGPAGRSTTSRDASANPHVHPFRRCLAWLATSRPPSLAGPFRPGLFGAPVILPQPSARVLVGCRRPWNQPGVPRAGTSAPVARPTGRLPVTSARRRVFFLEPRPSGQPGGARSVPRRSANESPNGAEHVGTSGNVRAACAVSASVGGHVPLPLGWRRTARVNLPSAAAEPHARSSLGGPAPPAEEFFLAAR